jgi:hypothetical protein
MKNNIFKYAAIGLMAMGVASCGDSWLDTTSKTDSTPLRSTRMNFRPAMLLRVVTTSISAQ